MPSLAREGSCLPYMPSSTPSEFIEPANLNDTLENVLIGKPMALGRQYLGIEVERLILHTQTQESAPLEFCRQLLIDLADDIEGKKYFDGDVVNRVDGDGYSFTMEPGGQLELATTSWLTADSREPATACLPSGTRRSRRSLTSDCSPETATRSWMRP